MSIRNVRFKFGPRRKGRFVALEAAAANVATTEAATADVGSSEQLDPQFPPMSPRDEAILLAHAAAQIEHGLLVQYLYSWFSIINQESEDGAISDWPNTLYQVAKEEMGHLVSVQSLLRALGGPLHFDREPDHFTQFYPFPFELRPFGLKSVARYVLAEMPDESQLPGAVREKLPEVRQDAGVISGQVTINRVGLLFQRLIDLICDLDDEVDFRDTRSIQPENDEWIGGEGVFVLQIHNKATAIEAMQEIAEQGEGMGCENLEDSHFMKFFKIWEGLRERPDWKPPTILPLNPSLNADDEGFIEDKLSQRWAAIFDSRYRRLLTTMNHALLLSRTDDGESEIRDMLVGWTFDEMRMLTRLATKLTGLPQHSPPIHEFGLLRTAGPPFKMPYTLEFPQLPLDRWRHFLALLDESQQLLDLVDSEDRLTKAIIRKDFGTDGNGGVRSEIREIIAGLTESDQPAPGE